MRQNFQTIMVELHMLFHISLGRFMVELCTSESYYKKICWSTHAMLYLLTQLINLNAPLYSRHCPQ